MKKNKKKKVFLWLILIIMFVVLLAFCYFYGQDLIKPLVNKEESSVIEKNKENKEKETVKEEIDTKEINNILGINDASDECGVQRILVEVSGRINDLSEEDKYNIVLSYASNNGLLDGVSSDSSDICKSDSGSCKSLSKKDYLNIASKYGITDTFEELFTTSIENDKYLFNVAECKINKYNHDLSMKKDAEEIIATDNVSIDGEEQTIEYTFKINNKNEYYLYSIK